MKSYYEIMVSCTFKCTKILNNFLMADSYSLFPTRKNYSFSKFLGGQIFTTGP